MQFITIKDRKAYLITFTAVAEDFERHRASFEKSASTFRFR